MESWDKLREQWKARRIAIRQDYATGEYSYRSLAKKWGITDARIWTIVHEKDKKSASKGQAL